MAVHEGTGGRFEAVGGSGGRQGEGGLRTDAGTLDGSGVDTSVDRVDAPAVDAAIADVGVDAPRDTGPTLLANGAVCRVGSECQFGNCVDGVCCESACSGLCQACAEPNLVGKCVTISGSPRGTLRARCPGQGTCAAVCNGSDAMSCQYPRSEKQCTPASCSAGMAKVASTCDGAGACTTVAATTCASNLCADTTQCAGGCSTAQPCGTGQYCEPTTKACLALKVNGDACTLGQDFVCASGQCVDGVCCDTACSGQCESCAESASKGRCVVVTGAPRGTRRAACAGVRDACRGVCDGVSRTQCAYPGSNVTCVPASCVSGSLTMASVCNTLGDCTVPPAPAGCHSGQCSATPGQCLVCTAGLACAGGLVCDAAGGVCVVPAALTIAPTSPPAFASTTVGQASASQTFAVTNTGGVPSGAAVASLGGGDAGEFRIVPGSTTCTAVLPAGGRCNVVVTFNPSSPGGKLATLTVAAAPANSVSVSLSGTGLRRLGDTCGATADCPVGFCIDGHCCATSTCGSCQTCTGAAGTCAAVASGPDPDSCVGTCQAGTCKGPGSVLWARSTGAAWIYGAAEGPNGTVVTAGTIAAPATVNLGGSTLTPMGAVDGVLGQFATADGSHSASSRFGSSTPAGVGSVYPGDAFVDATGATIVRGVSFCDTTAVNACTQINYGQGAVTPGGGPDTDGFIGRYVLSTGVPNWTATLKGPSEDKIESMAAGPGGTVYVAGFYSEGAGQSATLTSGTNVLQVAAAGFRDAVIAQLNPSTGAIGLVKTFAGPGGEEADSIAWTGSEIIVAGAFAGTTVFGPQPQMTVTSAALDIWVAKLDPTNGSARWVTVLSSIANDNHVFVAPDQNGDVYVTGLVGTQTTFGGFQIGGAGGIDIFVAKLRNADGSVAWAKSLGSAGDDVSGGIAVNAAGHVVICGGAAGPLQPGGPWSGMTDVVLSSFASDGSPLWTKVIGTSGTDYCLGAAAGSNAFYASIDLAVDIGPSIEGVSIVGPATPTGILLKIQP